jgi:hypothetical protein
MPAAKVFLPLLGNFGEHIDAGAHIFGTLGVVRGSGIQGMGPALLPFAAKFMEG